MASSRLRYQVVRCTSEDPEYPVSELLASSSQTRGWQTARFCEFPQEIGLQFESPVHLRQVQFLSHQSKIATKIELFTGLVPEGCPDARYETVQFKRLGYLSLDNNERSQFQARELKSVYVDVPAQFLRILLHKCHVNKHNIVNQVGLIALNCLGEALAAQPGDRVAPTRAAPPPAAIQAPLPAPSQPQGQASGWAASPTGGSRAQQAVGRPSSARQTEQRAQAPAEAVAPPPPAASEDDGLDERTREQLKELMETKRRAVDNEDFDEAKRCKEIIDRLKQTGQKIFELEERKKAAVLAEDYDEAKSIKVEIDRLRFAAENPQAPPQQPAPAAAAFAPTAAAPAQYDEAARPPWDRQQPQQAPRTPHGAGAPPPWEEASAARRFEEAEQWPAQAEPPERPLRRASQAPPPRPVAGGAQSGSAAGFGSVPADAPVPSGGRRGPPVEEAPESPTEGRGSPADPNHPLAGVPNFEDIKDMEPEELSGKALEAAGPLEGLLGEYLTRCVFSKTWNLRDAALQKLALDVRQGAYAGMSPADLLRGLVATLLQTVPDKNVQVFASSASLLQAVCHNLPLRRPEAQAALEPLLPAIAERLADANARAVKTAMDAHLDLARSKAVGTSFAVKCLLQPPKKKMNPKGCSARLQLLASLVQEAGVQPDAPDGVPLEPAMQLAMDWFGNPAADVRDSAVRLVGACFAHVGIGRIEKYLASLKSAQREKFDAEFERVSGSGASASPMASPTGRGRGQPPAQAGGRGDGGRRAAAAEEFRDGFGGQPAPQAPPPRGGGGGQQRPAAASGEGFGRAREAAAPPPRAAVESDDDYEDDVPEFTCHFCGRQDPIFTPEALDVHYWRECPMLIQCQLCEQVIEIAKMHSHFCEECEAGPRARAAARDMRPDECPLCRAYMGACEEADWLAHLLDEGCPRNARDARGTASAGRGR